MAVAHYDVLFLGSGQSANTLAKAFASAGRRTLLVERSALGGTCVNVGCTPTKTMIASGRVAHMAARGADYGVDIARGFNTNMSRVRERKRDIVKQWHAGSERGLKQAGVTLMLGEGSFIDKKKIKIECGDGKKHEASADTIFISTGERPSRPDIPGLNTVDASRVVDSTSIMELGDVPKHLIVLGGGYIGLEFGQLFRRLGSDVTIVQRANQLIPREDVDVAECLLQILKEDGLTVHLSSTADAIEPNEGNDLLVKVNITTPEGKQSLKGSHILLATGRVPNTDSLNLQAAGVETTHKGHVKVNDRLETTAPGVYALGDVHGGPAFTHISYDDFRIIRSNLLRDTMQSTTPIMSNTTASSSRVLTPYVMYTDPQLGHVGLHDRDLVGRNVKTASMPMSYVARALETAEPRGLMKATVDAETGELLGFTCLGMEGGEVMSIVQTAMMGGLKWWDLEAAVWAHPTLAESLNNLWPYLK